MSSFYDSVNLETIYWRGSDWSYSIDLYNSDKMRDNVVLVTSRQTSSDIIRVETWNNMNIFSGLE